MVVTIVHQHGERPLQQSWSPNQVVPDVVSSHVAHFGPKSSGWGRHRNGLFGARRELQSNRVVGVRGSYVVNCNRDFEATIAVKTQSITLDPALELHIAEARDGGRHDRILLTAVNGALRRRHRIMAHDRSGAADRQ